MNQGGSRQRLLQLADERRIGLSRLSTLIGRNPSYLQQYVRKGSPRKLEETDRYVLARFFGVDEAELGAPEEISSNRACCGAGDGWADIPRLELGVSAGPGAVADGEQAIGAFRFSRRWLRDQGLDPAMLSAICVIGDSMEPTLRDGDEILVDRAARSISDGIHVVRLGETLLVKRLGASGPDRIRLISDNPAYPALELDPASLDVVGRVVWKCGRL